MSCEADGVGSIFINAAIFLFDSDYSFTDYLEVHFAAVGRAIKAAVKE
jgi:hypothetical protein